MPLAMDRISLESLQQSMCEKDHLLSSMHGTRGDNDGLHCYRQYRPCSRCASRPRPVLMVLPWILSVALLVCLVVAVNRTPQRCVKNMFWRELEFGIIFFAQPFTFLLLLFMVFSLSTVSNMLKRRNGQKRYPTGPTYAPVSSRPCVQRNASAVYSNYRPFICRTAITRNGCCLEGHCIA
jgi:hypothetical protein